MHLNKTYPRYLAIDVLRGLTVAFMLVVNNPGSWGHIYKPLKHAEWNGFTPADFIFPSFLFLVGLSSAISIHRRLEKGDSKARIITHIFWRSVLLFGAGLFLHLVPQFEWSTVRIPGVLQRIALVYLFVSLLLLAKNQWVLPSFFFLVLWGYAVLFQTVPTPDGHTSTVLQWIPTPTQNWEVYVDSLFLKGHLWTYTRTWDPEGILSTFPAICTAILGAGIGMFLISPHGSHRGRVNTVLFVCGVWLYAWGWVFGEYFPINKSIWSSSYVLFTAGISCVLLSFLTSVYHRKEISTVPRLVQSFVEPFGRNAFLAFFLSGLVSRLLVQGKWISLGTGEPTHLKQALYRTFFKGWGSPELDSFLYSLAYLLVFYIVFYILARFRIFIKL